MKKSIKLALMLGVVGPIAFGTGFALGYGAGKVVCHFWDKLDYYYYCMKRGL